MVLDCEPSRRVAVTPKRIMKGSPHPVRVCALCLASSDELHHGPVPRIQTWHAGHETSARHYVKVQWTVATRSEMHFGGCHLTVLMQPLALLKLYDSGTGHRQQPEWARVALAPVGGAQVKHKPRKGDLI